MAPVIVDAAVERAVLDCMLSSPEQLPAIRARLRPGSFYYDQHRAIYAAGCALYDGGAPIDPITVTAALDRRGPSRHGESWAVTVGGLIGEAPVWQNAATYADRLAELDRHRRIAQLAGALAADPTNTEVATRVADLLATPLTPVDSAAPFALDLDAFLADRALLPQALVGDADDVLLPAAGLLIEFAKGGRGKTTLTVDFAFHAASGVDWLGFTIERPLRILFVENEGPRESFRAKLEAKRHAWPHPIPGALFVHSFAWGSLSFANPEHVARLRRFVEAHAIDVVIGDPLDSLGLAGVGSPEDTRAFLGLLAQVGLFRDVAFVLLHHPRKEVTSDELDEAAGAWGGRPDTMLRLARQPGNRARLSFPKFRWSRHSQHPALILSFEPETASFALVAREDEAAPIDRDVTAELVALMSDAQWRTVTSISASKERGGIGARRELVTTTLTTRADLFAQAPGAMVGGAGGRVYWRLRTDATGAEEGS